MGDVSHVVPSIHPWLAIVDEGEALCHEHRFADAAGTDGAARTALLAAKVLARTAGRGADAVLLAVPNPALVEEALKLSRPGGRVLLFAHNDPVMRIEFPAAAIGVEEREILGSYSASIDDQEESARLVFERRIPVREMISHRFPLEKIADAIALAAKPDKSTLKIMVEHRQ